MNRRSQASASPPAALLLWLVAVVWAILVPVTAEGGALPSLLSGDAPSGLQAQRSAVDPGMPTLSAPERPRTELAERETWEPDDEIGSAQVSHVPGVYAAVILAAAPLPATGYIPTRSRLPLGARAPPRP